MSVFILIGHLGEPPTLLLIAIVVAALSAVTILWLSIITIWPLSLWAVIGVLLRRRVERLLLVVVTVCQPVNSIYGRASHCCAPD